MRLAAGFAHGADFVVERFPFLVEDMAARDDDIDLFRAIGHRHLDLFQAQRQRHQAGRKSGRHRGDGNARPVQRLHGRRDHGRIDADGARLRRRIFQAQRLDQIGAQRMARLHAQAMHPRGRVVAGQGGQVDALDRAHQPCGLPLPFSRCGGRARIPCGVRPPTGSPGPNGTVRLPAACLHCAAANSAGVGFRHSWQVSWLGAGEYARPE